MNTTTKTLVVILIMIVAVYLCSNAISHLVQILRRQVWVASIYPNRKRENLVDSFLHKDQPGKFFVAMICAGMLRSIKTINHGAEFPDDKQAETFRRYGTPVIKNALDEIGEGV